jgi:hypothetical protein
MTVLTECRKPFGVRGPAFGERPTIIGSFNGLKSRSEVCRILPRSGEIADGGLGYNELQLRCWSPITNHESPIHESLVADPSQDPASAGGNPPRRL